MKAFTLGLDLGASSLGWAIVPDEPDANGADITTGVRIFPQGTEPTKTGGEQSRNKDRRDARQMRRQLYRRRRRRRKVQHLLLEAGAISDTPEALAELRALDPYELRRRGLDEELAPAELGRVLMHMAKRRGFKSNKKAQGDARKEQNKVVGPAIDRLSAEMQDAGARTLGEYLAMLHAGKDKVRNRYTSRAMFDEEFGQLWSKQASFKPDLWPENLKERVYDAIFGQRPLKAAGHLIGKCQLEPDRQRAPRASWFAEQARLLQEVNNLKVLPRRGEERPLTSDERKRLLHELTTRVSDVAVDTIKSKVLALAEAESLNYEGGRRDKMQPNKIEARLRKLFGKDYEAKADWLRETVWESLVLDEVEDFEENALGEWGLSREQVDALYKIERPDGYSRFSLKALKKLLPYLAQGKLMHEAIKAAGYETPETEERGWLPPIKASDFRNPVVIRALSETRKVINAIVRQYGKPSRIVVELARETRGTIKSREERLKFSRQQEAYHKTISADLTAQGIKPSRELIEKYKLADECDWACPYTGRSIAFHQLFGANPEFDVEHIIPYQRSLDNGFMNKTLCAKSENQRKLNRTPYEAYHGTAQYDEILMRIRKLPYAKQRRFMMKEVPDDFANRQLVDTSYAARSCVAYLRQLGVTVDPTRGPITAELRWQWGLNSILGDDEAVKARDDHRHHAVDAVVIALTTKKHVNTLRRRYEFGREEQFPAPWQDAGVSKEVFRQTVRASVETINVSHRPWRRLQGRFNEETNYGAVRPGEGEYVYRVPLKTITPAKAAKIVDPVVRELVAQRLRQHGIQPGKGSRAVPAAVFEEDLRMPGEKGPRIESVRVRVRASNMVPITDETGRPYRYVEPGSNHHIAIFEYTDTKGRVRRCKEMVTRFEAARRRAAGEPVVRRTHAEHAEAKFLMWLCNNDLVLIHDRQGVGRLCRLQKMSEKGSSSVELIFREHTAATIDRKDTEVAISSLAPDKFKAEKVTVDLLGRIHPCND
jgi:CRISPR-associated endonuclease Csn1